MYSAAFRSREIVNFVTLEFSQGHLEKSLFFLKILNISGLERER